jgi:hypothetical protein
VMERTVREALLARQVGAEKGEKLSPL